MFKNSPYFAGRVLAVVWAGFWSFFAVSTALAQKDSLAMKAFVCLLSLIFFAGSAVICLRWRRAGGKLLLLEGSLLSLANTTFFHNPPARQIFLWLTLAIPPLLSGILLLRTRSQSGKG